MRRIKSPIRGTFEKHPVSHCPNSLENALIVVVFRVLSNKRENKVLYAKFIQVHCIEIRPGPLHVNISVKWTPINLGEVGYKNTTLHRLDLSKIIADIAAARIWPVHVTMPPCRARVADTWRQLEATRVTTASTWRRPGRIWNLGPCYITPPGVT